MFLKLKWQTAQFPTKAHHTPLNYILKQNGEYTEPLLTSLHLTKIVYIVSDW